MLRDEQIAALAHAVNKAYCESIGDNSQLSWGEAPKWQRDSAIAGVTSHMESDLTPEQSHELWLTHKERDGWKYGPVKDAEKKEHPCFIPYCQLPAEQKTKDYLFLAVVSYFK